MRAFDWEAKGVSWTKRPFMDAIQERPSDGAESHPHTESGASSDGKHGAAYDEPRQVQDRGLPPARLEHRGNSAQAPL
jgi:hypothetical protein